MRNWTIIIFLGATITASFLIWGDFFTDIFSEEKAIDFLKDYDQWAWLIGILLLMADLFLPLPGTIIISALGYIYGPLIGGIVAVLGSLLSGMLAYGLCRLIGRRGALWLLGAKDLARGEALFDQRGGWIVALSRWLPIIPEIVACMAGLHQMRFWKFTLALLCGSVPLGFVFAFIGYSGNSHPYFAVLASAIFPLILWACTRYFLRDLI